MHSCKDRSRFGRPSLVCIKEWTKRIRRKIRKNLLRSAEKFIVKETWKTIHIIINEDLSFHSYRKGAVNVMTAA